MRWVALLLIVALTGCQHIPLVKHPLPFDNAPSLQTLDDTEPPSNVADEADRLPPLLENWF